jgi:hypothetical protein
MPSPIRTEIERQRERERAQKRLDAVIERADRQLQAAAEIQARRDAAQAECDRWRARDADLADLHRNMRRRRDD